MQENIDVLWAKTLEKLPWFQVFLVNVLIALAILVIGIWIARRIRVSVKRAVSNSKRFDRTLGNTLANVAYYVVVSLIIYAALVQLGIKVPGILAAFGAMGLAVGLALKDTLRNIAAGIMLVALRPIKIGEYVETPKAEGTIVDIGFFATEIKASDGLTLFVPNAFIWDNRIQNFARHKERRLTITLGIGYDTDLEKAQQKLIKMLSARPEVLNKPEEPFVYISDFRDSSIEITIKVWLPADNWFLNGSNIRIAVKTTLDQSGIDIPYPQRVIINRPVNA